MAHIMMAYDPGTSESKLIYQINEQPPKLEFIPPDYVKLSSSFAQLDNEQIGGLHSDPINRAWFSLSKKGECILVGQIAAERGFTVALSQPKYVSLTYKIVGMLCAIACREKLDKGEITADILALLPVGEFGDAAVVKEELERLLNGRQKIYFQGSPLQIRLEIFQALPEGGGIILAKPQCRQGQTAILMLGYRNASVLAFNRGSFDGGRSASKNLGFYQLADKIVAQHSYLNREDIFAAVDCEGTSNQGKKEEWKPTILPGRLVTVTGVKEREREERRLSQTIELATLEYLKLLFGWLAEVLSPVNRWQQICVVGGTAHLFGCQIEEFFSQYNQRVDWCPELIGTTLRQFKLSEFHYRDRLTAIRAVDVWTAMKCFSAEVSEVLEERPQAAR